MIELGVLLVIGAAILTAVIVVSALLKAVFWVLWLPIRLVLWTIGGVLLLPFLLLKLIFGAIAFVVALPLMLLAALVSVVALALPLLPILFLVALLWYVLRTEPQALARS
jgi:hypothetical protein